jgi:hypothetical protein
MILDTATEEIGHVEMPAAMIARLLESSPVEAQEDGENSLVGAMMGGAHIEDTQGLLRNQSVASGRQILSGSQISSQGTTQLVLQLILTAASVAVPWTQQFRRPHAVRDLEIPSGTFCRLQTPRKPAAPAVVPCRSLPAAFLRVQPVGAGQIYQRHGREGTECKRVSAFALVVLLNADRDGRYIRKIARHAGPNPGLRIVTGQDGNTGCDLARAVAADDGLKTSDARRPADRSRSNKFGNAKRNGEIAKASGHFVMG